jgi:hypothetical protein
LTPGARARKIAAMQNDFVTEAFERTQADFAGSYAFPFLVGAVPTRPVTGPTPTWRGDEAPIDISRLTAERAQASADTRLVLAVRKVQDSFPSMITVGRTKNNDVVLPDPRVSKFHAYFRINVGTWELADAGSVNGTRIGDTVLPPKGQPQPVHFGDRIRFSELSLQFLDASATWQALRALR